MTDRTGPWWPACSLIVVVFGLLVYDTPPASGQTPWWQHSLGYSSSQISELRIGPDGFPYIPVQLDSVRLWLLFDTGNMVGVTVDAGHFGRLNLNSAGVVRRRDSSGKPVGEFRIGTVRHMEALGQKREGVRVHEFAHPRLTGLFGPADVPGSRFTLDYEAGVIAVATTPLPAGIGGTLLLPLVRSQTHPRLVLVEGEAQGRSILVELDTGKSRAVVDPAWAAAAGLVVQNDTVAVGAVRIGKVTFEVVNAKPVSLRGIDPDLPGPLVLSLGSDVLSRYVLTVDYDTGMLLLSEPPH